MQPGLNPLRVGGREERHDGRHIQSGPSGTVVSPQKQGQVPFPPHPAPQEICQLFNQVKRKAVWCK